MRLKIRERERGGEIMIFQIYDGRTGWQILGWVMVFAGLIIMNEIARRTKVDNMK